MAPCVSETLSHFVKEGDRRPGFIAQMDDCYEELLTDIVVTPSRRVSRGQGASGR
jgi:hypothetical protein